VTEADLNVVSARYELQELLAHTRSIGSHRLYCEVLTDNDVQALINLLANGEEAAQTYVASLIDMVQDDVLDQLNDRRADARLMAARYR
jgi:hypothetical protein